MHCVSAHSFQRSNGARAAHLCKCPSAAVGKPIQRVRAAAEFGAPAPRGEAETLELGAEVYGVTDSLITVWEQGLDADKVIKAYSGAVQLMEVWRKIWPEPVEVFRTSDPNKLPCPSSGLPDGLLVGRWVLISRGSSAAVEGYLLEALDVAPDRGRAYVVYKGRETKMKNPVRSTADFITMIHRADMFLVHDFDAKASGQDAQQ